LVVVQLQETPGDMELDKALLGDKDAIYFWKEVIKGHFVVPLEDFRRVLFKYKEIDVPDLLDDSVTPEALVAYQKYWTLWIFAGGDEQTMSSFLNNNIIQIPQHNVITVERFGLFLAWFGPFDNFFKCHDGCC